MLRKYRVNRELVRQDLATNFGELPFPRQLRLIPPVTLPEPPPVEALSRTNDPETSKKAAQIVHGKINLKQRIVLRHFQRIFPQAITDVELQKHFKETRSTLRSRRKELTDAGLIEPTGDKKKIDGTYHKVWVLTDKGRAVDLH
jgi:hypothetical protein